MPGYRNCKIVLGGDGDTGKTTIAQKLGVMEMLLTFLTLINLRIKIFLIVIVN